MDDSTNAPNPPAVPQTRSELWGQMLFVHALLLVAATAILWWRGVAPLDLFDAVRPLPLQVGLGAGLAVALVTLFAGGEWLIFRRSPSTDHLLDVSAIRQLTVLDSVLIGVLTGIVTEFTWRGAIQPWVGLMATTAMHGAIFVFFAPNPAGRVVMVVCGVALAAVCGLLTIHAGLVSAIVLRGVYEAVGTDIIRRRAMKSALASPAGPSSP